MTDAEMKAALDKWEEKLASGWRPRVASIRQLIALAREALAARQSSEMSEAAEMYCALGDHARNVAQEVIKDAMDVGLISSLEGGAVLDLLRAASAPDSAASVAAKEAP